jgi:hypothetical protein
MKLLDSTTEHQLVWSIKEALEDYNYSKFKSELSSNKRPLFDSNYNLSYLLCFLWSSRIYLVQLTTACSCSLQSVVMLYCEPTRRCVDISF